MSVYLYEESLIDSLREVTGDDRIHIISPDMSIRFFAQFDKDKVQFPAIVLSRNSVSLLGETYNQVVALKGETARVEDDVTVVKAKLIPMRIEWSVDVYAVDRFSCDEIVRELIYYFKTHPRFLAKIPYNLDIDQNFDIFLGSDIEDNSDLIEFPNKGELFRETFTIYTENAHFYSSSRQYPTYINIHSEITNPISGEVIET